MTSAHPHTSACLLYATMVPSPDTNHRWYPWLSLTEGRAPGALHRALSSHPCRSTHPCGPLSHPADDTVPLALFLASLDQGRRRLQSPPPSLVILSKFYSNTEEFLRKRHHRQQPLRKSVPLELGSKMKVLYDHLTPTTANRVISHLGNVAAASAAALGHILLRTVTSKRLKQEIKAERGNASDPPGGSYLFSLGVFDLM